MPITATQKSIASKLNLAMAGLAGTVVVVAGASSWIMESGLGAATRALSKTSQEAMDVQALAEAVKNAEINVIQVQQFLTDLSATRGLDGLDDGGAEAEINAQQFEDNLKRAQDLARKLNAEQMAGALNQAGQTFPDFYATGKRMAAVYVSQGPTGGNKIMPQFDAAAEKIHGAIDATLSSLAELEKTADDRRKAALQAAQRARGLSTIVNVAALLFSVAVAAALAAFVRNRIARPLQNSARALEALAEGRPPAVLDGLDRADEIGQLARAFTTLAENESKRQALELESRGLRDREAARQARLGQLIERFRGTVVTLLSAAKTEVEGNRETARELGVAARQSQQQAGTAAAASASASAEVQSVAAATEQLAVSVREISAQAERARYHALETRKVTDRGSKEMEELTSQAQRISAVIEIIRSVANQTDLLALNATIEAARAGEAGRGFAVVASEVKTLAEQTAVSTSEIESIVGSIMHSVGGVGRSFEDAMAALTEIDSMVATVASAVTEQDAATSEISQAIARASACTQDSSQGIGSVADAAAATSRAVEKVLAVASAIEGASDELNATVELFLQEVSQDLDERRENNRKIQREQGALHIDGRRILVTIRDITDAGAGIECQQKLEIGQGVALEVQGGQMRAARVVYEVAPQRYGLVFTQVKRRAA